MKNLFTKVPAKILLIALMLPFFSILLTGCISTPMDYYIANFPNKIVYEKGESVSFDGLKVKTINSDGTHRIVNLKSEDFSLVDTTTSGKKQVVITHDGISTSFDIFVASVVVNDADDLKTVFANLNDGDVVYLKSGNYLPKTNDDTSYQNIEVGKSVAIVGDGESTKFFGNFVVGATLVDNEYQKIQLQDVTIQDVRFCLDYQTKNNMIEYFGPYGNTDKNGAIRCFDTKNMTIKNCTFQNYAFGVFAENASGLTIQNCKFTNIFRSAIFAQKDTQNTIISNNIIVDTAKNCVCFEGENMAFLGAIILNFSSAGVKGVSICKNTINRTGLHQGDQIYYDQNSKEQAKLATQKIFTLSYINNSAGIILKSSGQDNLQVGGIVLSANNYGQALANIKMSTSKTDAINANGVLVIE